MSGELAPKLRLVRCPKCWQVLPESPQYDVYKCGGCGTTLQAKKRKSKAGNSESSTHETDAAPRNALNLVSGDKQCSNREQLVPSRDNGLRAKATSSSSRECSLDENGGRGQNENGECKGEQIGPINLSDEELESEMDIYKLSLRRHRVSNKGCSNELTHCEIEELNDTNLQLAGAEELNNGNLLLEGAKEKLTCASDEDGNNEKSARVGVKSEVEITGSGLGGAEELNNGNLSPEGTEEELISGSDGEYANDDKSALVGANPEVEITGSDTAGAEELNNGDLLLKGAEEELNMCASGEEAPNNDQSALVGAKSEVDIAGSASTQKLEPEKGSILRVTPCKFEEGTSGNPVSSPNEQQKQAQKSIHHSFDRVRSVDTFDTAEVIDPSSELSVTLGDLSKSPTARSYYAYDGSVSSYDGMDERFPTHHVDSFDNTYTVANGVSEGRHRKGKGLVNGMLYGDLEAQPRSYLPNGKHHFMKDSGGNQNKVLETTRHGNRHWMRTKRDEFPPRIPFHRIGSQSGYERGSSSNQMHNELYRSSSFLSPDSCEDTDQEKMKLLRMIQKLQDQLDRTSYMSGETTGSLSTGVSYKGKHISARHSHDLHEGRFYHVLDYPMCNGNCSHGINWRQGHKFSRIPYSAEATSSTHHVDHSCFRCRPLECQCSADLPPHVLFQHEELCRSHPGHSRCSSTCSYPPSPQWFTASKLPVYGRGPKSDDQRHRAPGVKKYFREKTKRHYRAVAGGAPFVTCHNCLKLLQLPADFLLFKRVCHQLKCGACSKVLKFSLQNGSHIVSYSPNAIGPPSSDLDDQGEVIHSSNLHSTSHANYYHYSPAEPIAYSDDYGLSVSKSYSSEGDPVSLTQFHPLHGSENDNPGVSHGAFEPITEEEKIGSIHSSTSKTPVKKDEAARLSSNMSRSEKLSSEMEAQSAPKSSSLHQLMGYSSPSQVIRGTKSPWEGIESTLNGENDPSQERES